MGMHMAGGVVTAVLAKAVQNQQSSESRPCSETSACDDTPLRLHSDMFDMFGTNDPAAEQEIADIGMRRRRESGSENVDRHVAELPNIRGAVSTSSIDALTLGAKAQTNSV